MAGSQIRFCPLASGSSGNLTFVATERTRLLVDCGTSAKEAVARLASVGCLPSQLDGILITHAHYDHYRSAGTLHARFGVPVHVDPSTAASLARRGLRSSWRRIREHRPIPPRIGDIDIEALDTSHGFPPHEGRTVCYRLSRGDRSVAVVTDLGTCDERLLRRLRGVDAIVLEANYDERTLQRKLGDPSFARDWQYLSWVRGSHGHLSNRQCAEALAAIVQSAGCDVFLGHSSENHHNPFKDNNDYQLAAQEVARLFASERLPLPRLHRAPRIGREPARPGPCLEIG